MPCQVVSLRVLLYVGEVDAGPATLKLTFVEVQHRKCLGVIVDVRWFQTTALPGINVVVLVQICGKTGATVQPMHAPSVFAFVFLKLRMLQQVLNLSHRLTGFPVPGRKNGQYADADVVAPY